MLGGGSDANFGRTIKHHLSYAMKESMWIFHPWWFLRAFTRLRLQCGIELGRVFAFLTNERSSNAMVTGLQPCVWSGFKSITTKLHAHQLANQYVKPLTSKAYKWVVFSAILSMLTINNSWTNFDVKVREIHRILKHGTWIIFKVKWGMIYPLWPNISWNVHSVKAN